MIEWSAFAWEGRLEVGTLTALLTSIGLLSVGATCMVGLAFLVVAAIIIGAAVWGVKKGKLRVVANERNFDDFGN